MIVIEVKDATVLSETRVVKDRPATFREQWVWASWGGEVRKVRVSLGRERPGYPVGRYQVADESYTVGQYGDLTITRLVLTPVAAAASAMPGRQAS